MAWLDRLLFGRKSANAYDAFRDVLRLRRTAGGRAVTIETAIAVSAVFGCCRVIGNGMAQIPFKLMRESPDGKTRAPAKDHPLYRLLATKPNPWQTSFEFREQVSWHVELAREAFIFVNRSVMRGEILELIPLEPSRVTVQQGEDYSLTYKVRSKSGSTQDFPQSAIWHIRGPSWDGWRGIDVLQAAREAIGLAQDVEEAQAQLHRNGVKTSGAYTVEGTLTKTQYESLREWITREHVGPDNAGTPMILDRAAKWINTSMTGIDAQTIETRRQQVEEICRFMGVMPIMVGYSDKTATFASAEAMFLAHAVHCLSPRWARFEQSADANLLTEQEREDGLYFDFVEEGMIRGSAKDTKDVLLGYVNGGVMTPNEGRAKLDLNPDPDPESDRLRIPVNVAQESAQSEGTPSDAPSSDVAKSIDALLSAVKLMVDKAGASGPSVNVALPNELTHQLNQRVEVDVPGIAELANAVMESNAAAVAASTVLSRKVDKLTEIARAPRVPEYDPKTGEVVRSVVALPRKD